MTAPAPDCCPFCAAHAAGPGAVVEATIAREGELVAWWPDAAALVPLNPVVPDTGSGAGHLLVVPAAHVADAATDAEITAVVARRAGELLADLGWQANLITSRGPAATQTVFHLHVHIVCRTEGDGLALPWSRRYLTPTQWQERPAPEAGLDAQRAGLPAAVDAARQSGHRTPLGAEGLVAVVSLAEVPACLAGPARRASLTWVRAHLAQTLAAVVATGPVVITRHGRDQAALVAVTELT